VLIDCLQRNDLDLKNPKDKDRAFDFLASRGIFKKFMPCYLQVVDLDSSRKNKSTLDQFTQTYVNKFTSFQDAWTKEPTLTEEAFIQHFEKELNIDFWKEDISYFEGRRDMYILDIHELIQLYGRGMQISTFYEATTSISKYMATYIYDLLYPFDEEEYGSLGMIHFLKRLFKPLKCMHLNVFSSEIHRISES